MASPETKAVHVLDENHQTSPSESSNLGELLRQVDTIMAHAWMVRTFVKHSEEVEDFPELMQVVRAIFDTARALEARRESAPALLLMLRKKLPKLREAARQFRIDAPKASTHTNFAQAVVSLDGCVAELEKILRNDWESSNQPAADPHNAGDA